MVAVSRARVVVTSNVVPRLFWMLAVFAEATVQMTRVVVVSSPAQVVVISNVVPRLL